MGTETGEPEVAHDPATKGVVTLFPGRAKDSAPLRERT
ncbi:hypothetical protein HNR57_000778 [Streptomyces paradoxus]|uniref:Uncharacterized protein n=1 Tax=Streptomyces paradoxus TaxID=66375 RepID=A0A7W9T696_9ACTN|nr:hypothetical protein [Streptomyces paradoxus]